MDALPTPGPDVCGCAGIGDGGCAPGKTDNGTGRTGGNSDNEMSARLEERKMANI